MGAFSGTQQNQVENLQLAENNRAIKRRLIRYPRVTAVTDLAWQ